MSGGSKLACCDRSLVQRQVTLDFVDLYAQLLLAFGFFVELLGKLIELGPRSRHGGLSSNGFISSSLSRSVSCFLLLILLYYFFQNFVVLNFSWRENALADILRIIHDPLVFVFAVNKKVLRNHLAVVVSKNGVEQVVIAFCLFTNHLGATEGVESVVLGTISPQVLRVRTTLR